jgi:hypothetical protein
MLFGAAALLAAAAGPDGKYNPGHYVALEVDGDLAAFPHLDEPAIRGFNIRYMWATLEPVKDRYDFSVIRRDLEIAAKHRKHFVVFLTDKTFSEKAANPIPEYMRPYALVNLTGGVNVKKWDPYVVEREIALTRALAKEFDGHPNFEGIAWQESAPSVTRADLAANGYTAELFRDALIRLLKGSSDAFARSWVFWYQNFLPGNNGYLRDIAQAVAGHRVVLCGPDILPHRTALLENYKLYDEFRGKLKLASSAQADSYRHHKDDTQNGNKRVFHSGQKPIHPDGYVPMQQIFEFGSGRMHLNYIFWSYVRGIQTKQYPGDPLPFTFNDALPVIRQNPAFNQ